MTDRLTLSLMLLDGREATRIDGVASLVAGDASGQFGLQPAHEALVTVKTHLYNIFKKIDVPNRLQATLWAAKNL